jgi:Nitroreductase family
MIASEAQAVTADGPTRAPGGVLMQILERARWAPSGDNTQPWRFEIVGPLALVVHGFDTRDHCVYDLDGRPSQMSIGCLLETMRIAASVHGLAMQTRRRIHLPDTTPTFDVAFHADPAVTADPLEAVIETRSVQRRPMRMRPLTAIEKAALEASVGDGYRIVWFEGFATRLRVARLMFRNAKLRLTMPEAYEVHRAVIEWNASTSVDRVPDRALGIDPMTARLMRFVMKSWGRVRFFNSFLAGTWAPRIQMDFIPSVACAAHFVIVAERAAESIDDCVEAGRAVQRFWLTATALGLVQQPEMTPLIFGAYVRRGTAFTTVEAVRAAATRLTVESAALIGSGIECAVWMGRVGTGPTAACRSIRKPLNNMVLTEA